MARARRRWMREQGMFDAARLVFIDETSANTKMVLAVRPLRPRRAAGGACPAGSLEDHHLRGRAASARHASGADNRRRDDWKAVPGLCRTVSCPAAQTWRYRHARQPSGSQGCRHPRGDRGARRGATLRYLPKYSPDLNPIEMPFSKLKADLRKAAERSIPRLRRRIGRFAPNLTARQASNCFRHAGYA